MMETLLVFNALRGILDVEEMMVVVEVGIVGVQWRKWTDYMSLGEVWSTPKGAQGSLT